MAHDIVWSGKWSWALKMEITSPSKTILTILRITHIITSAVSAVRLQDNIIVDLQNIG